ncbi:MAG: TIGR01777 family oxidoreductase [Acidobacteriales bacterium]|nr:TIGR01777 family oxidoreductase [Terriglobales bacterium]
MNITITGATGFVGRRAVNHLLAAGHQVHCLGRALGKGMPSAARFSIWHATTSDPPEESLEGADAVIHLVGEPVGQRWTPANKKRILETRIEGTRRLVNALSRMEQRPKVLVSASAVGIYGSRGEEVLTERSEPGQGFLTDVCRAWEKEAGAAEALGVRVVKLRLGMVLGPEGGALAQMLPFFRIFLGGTMGFGMQWMSWIHVEDLIDLMLFAIEKPGIAGPINAVSPNPVSNAEFTQTLARVLHRPAELTVSESALRLLFGEGAAVALSSQRVMPDAATKAGFEFRHPNLEGALKDLLG